MYSNNSHYVPCPQHQPVLTRSQKMSRYLWGPKPVNPLSESHMINTLGQTLFRIIAAIFHVFVLIWTTCAAKQPYYVLAYLTVWGFSFCTFYFVLVTFVSKSPDNTKKWRFVCVLGEMGAALEFLICPFFFLFLYPYFVKNSPAWDAILLQVCLHLICPMLMWTETFTNGLSFPKRHIWFLVAIVILYPINNYVWSEYIFNAPVYPVITWHDNSSYVYLIAASVVGFIGYFVGTLQYRLFKKKNNYQKIQVR